MLIYSCALDFEPSVQTDSLLTPIAEWLGIKLGSWIEPSSLVSDHEIARNGARLEVVAGPDGPNLMVHACLTHGDSTVRGRDWSTEIGIRRNGNSTPTTVTVLLKAEDASAEIASDHPVTVTRPTIVADLLRSCSTTCRAPGRVARWLIPEQLPLAQAEADDVNRGHPILILSPHDDGRYSIDYRNLLWQVGGLADVWMIPPDMNTWELQRDFPTLAAWRGAIKVLWPHSPRLPYIPFKVFVRQDLDRMANDGPLPNQVLSRLLTVGINRRNQLQHVSAADVRRIQLEHLSGQIQRDASMGDETRRVLIEQAQLIENLQSEKQSLKKEITDAIEMAAAEEERANTAEHEKKIAQHNAAMLKLQLEQAGMPPQGDADSDLDLNEAIGRVIAQKPTLIDGLKMLAGLWPERVHILESAWSSANDAQSFEKASTAIELLWQLATTFWNELTNGQSMEQAGKVFGKSYATWESETVMNNTRAREARTFIVDGQPHLMCPHLKIGTKDSIARTWRCHFDWDASQQRIIIGWCGKHLPHR